MTTAFEVVGVVNADVADKANFGDDTILVEHDDPTERLVCQPKTTEA